MSIAGMGDIAATVDVPGSRWYTTTLHGQHEPDLEFRLQRLVRERRVARAKNHVLPKILIELLLQRLLHVDRRQHAEAFLLERRGHTFDRLSVIHIQIHA